MTTDGRSRAATSLFWFGLYCMAFGLLVAFVPNTMLPLFRIETTDEPWIRLAGMFWFAVGLFYSTTSRWEYTRFYWVTVYARASVTLFFLYFVFFADLPPQMLLVSTVDLLAAIWTALALRADKNG